MKELLNKISKNGLILDTKEGRLQIFSTKEKVDKELVSQIKLQEQELVAYLLKHKKSSIKSKKYEDIPKCLKSESYPVSNAQLRIWLASQTQDSSAAYNMPSSIVLNGDYNLEIFQKAIHAVIERHEILRTVFNIDTSGEIRQYILTPEKLNFEISFEDFSHEKKSESVGHEYISNDSKIPFDLQNGPLLRATLIRLSSDKYMFYYNMHHIISDQWSVDVLSNDVMRHYNLLLPDSDVSESIEPLRIQYKDYTVWQLKEQNRPNFQSHKEYWLSQFEKDITILNLPSNKERLPVRTYNGRAIGIRLFPKETSKLKLFTKKREGSLFSGLFAAWNVLLFRYTQSKDIILGNPVGGRNHPDLENQIGYYLHTLALRNEIDPNHNFKELYAQINDNMLEAYKHQIYPFDQLIKDLNIKRNNTRNPLFDILVDYHGVSKKKSIFFEDSILYDLGSGVVKFDLELHITEVDGGVDIVANYNQDVYEKSMIEQLLSNYKRLIISLLEQPSKQINKISFLTNDDLLELKYEFNNTEESKYPSNKTILDLFKENVKETPDAIAIEYEATSLTYQELEDRSNLLADCLIGEYKIVKEDFVGVHLDRSDDYIVAIFGILKAGAVYVPIDTGYPSERKKYMIEDAEICLLISNTSYMFNMDYYDNALLAIDVELDKSFEKIGNNTISVQPNDLAYVIYTSGSTGNPKGVMIEHHSLTNYLMWCKNYYLKDDISNYNFGLFTSPSFDLTITSIFLPLINGGKLKVFSEKLSVTELFEEYLLSNISCIKLTPSHIDLLKNFDGKDVNLDLVIVGGEELKENHVAILRRLNPDIKIYNEYGPTEATVGCISYKIEKPEDPIYIGKPIHNTYISILDNSGELVPVGVVGEICVGGEGVSRGYLKRPSLTAEKFIVDSFDKSSLLYKTGDLGCWLPDGNIKFKGRKDDQIKVRGYRIELEEIESKLNSLDYILQSAVIAKEDSSGSKQLIGCFISKNEVDPNLIQKDLEKKLPEYMVPKVYTSVEKIPLTHNGKIDRAQLCRLNHVAKSKKEYVAPVNETEIKLVQIWKVVLGIEKIGVLDDFFQLGGHSLLAVKLCFEITKMFEVNFEINTVFKYSTIQSQSQYLEIVKSKNNKEQSDSEEVMYL